MEVSLMLPGGSDLAIARDASADLFRSAKLYRDSGGRLWEIARMVSHRIQAKYCAVCGYELTVMSSRRRYCNQCREGRRANGHSLTTARPADPSPPEIARMTAEIRGSWSEQTRAGRYVGPLTAPWEAPLVHLAVPID